MDIEAYRSIFGPLDQHESDMRLIDASRRGAVNEVIDLILTETPMYTGAVYVAARHSQRDVLFLLLDTVNKPIDVGKHAVAHACSVGNYDLALELRERVKPTDEEFWFMCLCGARRGPHMPDVHAEYYYGIRVDPLVVAEEKLGSIIEVVEKHQPSAAALVGGFLGACESGKRDEALRQYERCRNADSSTLLEFIPDNLRGGSVADLGLHSAALGGHVEIMRAMMARGARMFGPATTVAAKLGHADAVGLLLEQKLDQDCLNSAYTHACESDNYALVKDLRRRLGAITPSDCDALCAACRHGRAEIAIGLISLAGLRETEIAVGIRVALERKSAYKLAWFLMRWITSPKLAEMIYKAVPPDSNYWIQEIKLWILGTTNPELFTIASFRSDEFVQLVKRKHPKLGASEPIAVWFGNRLRLAERYIKLARGLLLATTPLAEALVDLVMQY